MEGFILVDFPRYCVDCKFCREINEGTEACCEMTRDPDEYDCYRMIDDYCQSRPQWCPIKQIPYKKTLFDSSGNQKAKVDYCQGWNDCIKNMLDEQS